MALEVTTNRQDFLGNGVTTDWPTNFKFWLPSEIEATRVDLQGVEHPLTQPAEYQVSGGDGSTGVVTVTPALPGDGTPENSERLIVRRLLPLEQLTRLINQGPFFPKTVETEFDKTNARIQQHGEELGRAIRSALSEDPNTDLTFPPYWGGRVIGWDPLTPRLVNFDLVDTGPHPTTPFGLTWIGLADELAGRNFLDVRRRHAKDGPPGPDDDETNGFAVDDIVRDTNDNKEYVCRDAAPASAVWQEYQTGGGGGGGGGGAYLGEVKYFTGAIPTIAQGWLPLGDTTYSTTTNPEYQPLYDYMVAIWGNDPVTGVGPATAFRTPPIDARFILTAGPGIPDADPELNIGPYTAGTTGGKEQHKLTSEQSGVPPHTHPYNENPYKVVGNPGGTTSSSPPSGGTTSANSAQDAASAHENRPQYAVCNGAICWNPALEPRVASFIDLDDTPLSYANGAEKSLVVAPGQNSVQFEYRVRSILWDGAPVESEAQSINLIGTAVTDVTTDGSGNVTAQVDGTGGGGHVIQDDGTPMPQRANLNFTNFTLADDPGGDATDVTALGQLPDIAQHSMYARLSAGVGPGEEMVVGALPELVTPAGNEHVPITLASGALYHIKINNLQTGAAGQANTSTTPAQPIGPNEADINMQKDGANLPKKKIVGTAKWQVTDALDTVTGDVVDSAINHDALSNYDANQHVDHTAVTIAGANSVNGSGTIDGDVTLDLVNDAASPGNRFAYSTDGAGAKGWHSLEYVISLKGQIRGHNGTNEVAIPPGVDGSFLQYDSTQPAGLGSQAGISTPGLPALGGDAKGTDLLTFEWDDGAGGFETRKGTVTELMNTTAGDLIRSQDEGLSAGDWAPIQNQIVIKQTAFNGHTKVGGTTYYIVDDTATLP